MQTGIAVSVVVSTRNRAHYLPDCMRALAAQKDGAPFEVVVVDNGSTDETAGILEAWCSTDPRFRTVYEPRLGLSCGKNAGIRHSRGPLLLFTDDDTLVDSHWIHAYVEFFEKRRGELMLAGGAQIPIPHDLGPWPAWLDEPALADIALLQYGEQRPLLHPAEYVWGANMAVPRDVFELCGGWDETVGPKGTNKATFEDTEFQDRFRSKGGTVWFCPTAVIHHRVDRHTITPRRIWSTAFARGRNDVWKEAIPIWRDVSRVPKRNAAKCVLRLLTNLFRWMWWGMMFRLLSTKGSFERARRSAFDAGRALDSLRAGRDSVRFYLAVSRVAFRVRHLLLQLAPDLA